MLWRGFPHSWKRARWPLAVGVKQVELSPHLDKRREEGLPTSLGNTDRDWAGEPVRFPPDTSNEEEVNTVEFTTRLEVPERGRNLRKLKSRLWRGRLISERHGHDLAAWSPAHRLRNLQRPQQSVVPSRERGHHFACGGGKTTQGKRLEASTSQPMLLGSRSSNGSY